MRVEDVFDNPRTLAEVAQIFSEAKGAFAVLEGFCRERIREKTEGVFDRDTNPTPEEMAFIRGERSAILAWKEMVDTILQEHIELARGFEGLTPILRRTLDADLA